MNPWMWLCHHHVHYLPHPTFRNYAPLLGRKANWPNRRYSTLLAGFAEVGETLEECCRRTIYDESGVTVRRPIVGPICGEPTNLGPSPKAIVWWALLRKLRRTMNSTGIIVYLVYGQASTHTLPAELVHAV
jgi:hypothetical protein